MYTFLVKNQNWAKFTPWMAIIATIILFKHTDITKPIFWALINIPLYLFHQTEEHYKPGGFKDFINHKINNLPIGQEALTDTMIFWVNILLVWVAFAIFGALATFNIGFGLLIIIFSLMNCATHIFQGFKKIAWNPGLIMASIQFLVSIYAAYFITTHGLNNTLVWWIGAVIFSIVVHALLFKTVMTKHQ